MICVVPVVPKERNLSLRLMRKSQEPMLRRPLQIQARPWSRNMFNPNIDSLNKSTSLNCVLFGTVTLTTYVLDFFFTISLVTYSNRAIHIYRYRQRPHNQIFIIGASSIAYTEMTNGFFSGTSGGFFSVLQNVFFDTGKIVEVELPTSY